MYQKIVIVGRLGRDPEMRYLPDGTAVTNMNVATDRRWTDKATGQPAQETTWFRVSVWGRQAESVNQYLSKGRMVLIEGHLRPDPQSGGPRIYTRQDGTAGSSFELFAESVRFLGGREDGGSSAGSFDDSVNGIDVDSEGNIYVAGETRSADFPLVGSEYDFRGVSDAFVAKLDPTGARLIYSKLIGGDGFDRATSIAVTPAGSAAIAVWTLSLIHI